MKALTPRIVTLVIALSALALAPRAWAGPATDQVRNAVGRVIQILQDPALKAPAMARERRGAIRQVANGIFDFPEIAKRALGPHWRELSAADQEEFVGLFTDLLERAYITKIERYSGEQVTYTGESASGDEVTVNTHFTTREGTRIPILYRMLRHDSSWRVYDVLIEGVSLTANYRTQFDRIIRTSSYAELVKRMKARVASTREPS